jgi:hypothetical protein
MATVSSTTPTTTTIPTTTPTTPTPSSDRPSFLTSFKEVITAVLALTVLGVTAYMLVDAYNSSGAVPKAGTSDAKDLQDAFGRQKDILLYGLSLLGAVIGYYFGRVPAELHAQAAQKQATDAQKQLGTTQDKLADASSTAVQAVEEKKSQAQEFRRTLSVVRSNLAQPTNTNTPVHVLRAQPQSDGVAQALAEVDEMLTRLDT